MLLLSAGVFVSMQGLAQGNTDMKGAWEMSAGGNRSTMILSDKYFAVAIYDVSGKNFVGTYGGSYKVEGSGYVARIEFHSISPELVGQEFGGSLKFKDKMLTIGGDDGSTEWKRIDDGTPGKLAGAWVITGRVRDG